jgi:hypothetical protein
MAQAGFTPVVIYNSGTTTNVPLAANLAYGELAINYTDGKLFYKNGSGVVVSFASGATINNDTATSSNVYPLFASVTTGAPSTIYTSNAKLLYKPSTGDFQSEQLVAGNGLHLNNQTINTSYSVPATQSAMSTGPITLASAVSVTLASGARWVIL